MDSFIFISHFFKLCNFISVREMKYSISTNNLYFMSAFSEKNSDNSSVFERYLPSIGEIAFNDEIDIK